MKANECRKYLSPPEVQENRQQIKDYKQGEWLENNFPEHILLFIEGNRIFLCFYSNVSFFWFFIKVTFLLLFILLFFSLIPSSYVFPLSQINFPWFISIFLSYFFYFFWWRGGFVWIYQFSECNFPLKSFFFLSLLFPSYPDFWNSRSFISERM